MKKVQRINESQLNAIVTEAVKNALNEIDQINEGKLSRAAATLALGGALMLGGHGTGDYAHAAERNNARIEQTAKQSSRVFGNIEKIPQENQREVMRLAEKLAKQHNTNIYLGVGRSSKETLARKIALTDAMGVHGSYDGVVSQNQILQQVWDVKFSDGQTYVVVRFFTE